MIALYACGGEQGTSEHPLGLGFLKSNVKAEIKIVKHIAEAHGADILGLSTNAWGLREALAIRADPTWPMVVLGGQGTLWPGLSNGGNFDFVVRGDGELALQAIVDGTAPSKVFNMRVESLDSLNPPDRGVCASGCIPISTSRGCPFSCAFCSSHAQWGKPRFNSIGWVMADIADCVKRYKNIIEFNILDDLWSYPIARFREFRDAWLAAGYHKKYRLRGFIRSNMASEELFLDMKRMGFTRIRFGAESGSDRVLKSVSKGETVADHQRAIDIAHSVGFPISASFMRGIPGETPDDLKATLAFIAKNKGKLIVEGNYIFKPFPGAPLWKDEDPLATDMRVR
jgi:radical SAM superfamily enzyme YgiQ (UPF0313 family)